jgi:hypothetical protein
MPVETVSQVLASYLKDLEAIKQDIRSCEFSEAVARVDSLERKIDRALVAIRKNVLASF